MARGKLSLKFIEHKKTRITTLKKRMKSLKKKAYELAILCEVGVCMIILEPELKDSPAKVEVWPEEPDQVNTIIGKYKSSKFASDARNKNFSICDFFNIRKRQVHDEVVQIRKANFKAKFPTWDERINSFSPEEIASFLTKLDYNLGVVKKIMSMKQADDDCQSNMVQYSMSKPYPFPSKNLNHFENRIQAHVPLEILNQSDHFQTISQKNLNPSSSAKPLNIQFHSLSSADDASVKLSLNLNNPMNNNSINHPFDKFSRMSMMNDIDFRVQSGIAASSSSSIPNNYPAVVSYIQDPRFGLPNNDVMFNPTVIQDNMMFQEPKAAAAAAAAFHQTCYYAPSMAMQPELASYSSNQQLMMQPVFPQGHQQPQFSDFYHVMMDDY